jgi:hypothetical protein
MRGLPRGGCHSLCICAVHRTRLCYRPATTCVTRLGGFSSFPFRSGRVFLQMPLRAGTLPRGTQHRCARWRDAEDCVLSKGVDLVAAAHATPVTALPRKHSASWCRCSGRLFGARPLPAPAPRYRPRCCRLRHCRRHVVDRITGSFPHTRCARNRHQIRTKMSAPDRTYGTITGSLGGHTATALRYLPTATI